MFRLETKWRIEAAELIDALPAFDDLPVETLNDLAGRVSLRRVRAGQPVFRQGDRPTAFYVVRNGPFAVEEEHPDTGDVQVLRTMERGESFGEMGLLDRSAPGGNRSRGRRRGGLRDRQGHVRSTARRLDPCPGFRADDAGVGRAQGTSARSQAWGPTSLAELLEHGRWATLPPGIPLVTQGDASDLFYVIHSGQATVSVDGTRRSAPLGPGSHFGEIGLLSSAPRSATVTTLTPMRAFVLDREGFDRVSRKRSRVAT